VTFFVPIYSAELELITKHEYNRGRNACRLCKPGIERCNSSQSYKELGSSLNEANIFSLCNKCFFRIYLFLV
jgi:hypothetical protein